MMPSYQYVLDQDFTAEAKDLELLKLCETNCEKDSRDIKRVLRVEQFTTGTHITAISVLKEGDNDLLLVPVETSVPLNLEVYDTVRDVYVVDAIGYIDLGYIPINYRLMMESAGDWGVDVPVPPQVIRRYLSKEQKSKLDRWKSKWCKKDYTIEYLQSLRVY